MFKKVEENINVKEKDEGFKNMTEVKKHARWY